MAKELKRPRLLLFLFLCLFVAFLAIDSLWALDPGRRTTQYGHTSWRLQDGTLASLGSAITQTTDGYIWMTSGNGLIRFDGVRFSPWVPPNGAPVPTRGFTSLLGARDGSLWLGTLNGLSRLKDGHVQTYSNGTESTAIGSIFEDRAGAIWVTRYRVPQGSGPLCQVAGNGLRCYGKADGISVGYGLGITEDTEGNIWFGSSALCRWRPGSSSTYFDDVLKGPATGDGVVDVAAGESGSIWATIDGTGPQLGVRHYSAGKWASYVVPGFDGTKVRSHALLMDRNKSLWVGTETDGLYHVHDGVADHYGSADGLSGNSVGLFYEDHEGNLWVLTEGGVDMFRDTAVVSFTMREGLSSSGLRSILALRDGSIWAGNEGAVEVLRSNRNSPIAKGKGLPGQDVAALLQDHSGKMWLGLDSRLMTYDGSFHEVKRQEGSGWVGVGIIVALAEDTEYNIWALTNRSRLFRITNKKVQEEVGLIKELLPARFLAADRKAGIWIGSGLGTFTHYRQGNLQTISLENHGSRIPTLGLVVDADNSLLVATRSGLFRWNGRRFDALDVRNGLPCNTIVSVIKDKYGSLWLYAQCGLLRISASDVAKWQQKPDSQLTVTAYDAFDGAHPGMGAPAQPTSSMAPDGRLWFIAAVMAQTVDPDHLFKNALPPPVHIEGVTADRKDYQPYNQLRLPALTRDLEIDYTALSFMVPQKVRFRYQLEGRDTGWEEPGTRRQAFYSDLPPGKYRFRVIACNNDGVWNEEGATLEFSIAPAWFQSIWFRVASVLAVFLVVWMVYRLRVRQVARAISARFDERLAERTRMARDLHDTFLQTIQGSKMVADDALDSADSVRMHQAMERLSVWLGQANDEGRAVLQALRTSTTQGNDLAEAFQRATEDGSIPGSMAVTFSMSGDSREMHPIVRDEVYRIGYEAIRNAYMHSGATQLDIKLGYAHDLTISVIDNGRGIDVDVAAKGKQGHFGLQGMRERAARIGGKLLLVSSATSGTEITLTVPGGIVFRKAETTPLAKIKAAFRRMRRTFDSE